MICKRARDTQKYAFYTWEREIFKYDSLMQYRFTSLDDMNILVIAIAQRFNCHIPVMAVTHNAGVRSYARYAVDRSTKEYVSSDIHMHARRWSMHVLLHEMAHIIVFNQQVDEPAHGPTFIGHFLLLVQMYASLEETGRGDEDQITDLHMARYESARDVGLKVAHPIQVITCQPLA